MAVCRRRGCAACEHGEQLLTACCRGFANVHALVLPCRGLGLGLVVHYTQRL